MEVFTPEQVSMISDIVTRVANDYELTPRCTELAVLDDSNTKLLKRYLASLTLNGLSKNTVYAYMRTLVRLSETMKMNYVDMGVYEIRYYLACEKQRGISMRSVENTRANISAFFQWLSSEEVIPKNPCANIRPIQYSVKERKAFSDVEIDALRSACTNTRDRALIELLLSSGVRVSELASLEVGDVDFTSGKIVVRHGKGSKLRFTFLDSVAIHHLKEYLTSRPEKDATSLFLSKHHLPLTKSGVRTILSAIAVRAGVENVHPHRFRRTFATKLAARGMKLQDIQKLMGHSNPSTTMEYIAISTDQLENSYKSHAG
jgi:site-specific recombinase XerD